MEVLIGALSALVVVAIDRQLERRHSKQAWLREQTLRAAADYLTARNKVTRTYIGWGGYVDPEKFPTKDRLGAFFDGGGIEMNNASQRLSLLGDEELVSALLPMGEHVDMCFNASYWPEMDLELYRKLLYDDEGAQERFWEICRRVVGAPKVDLPSVGEEARIEAFRSRQEARRKQLRPEED